MKTRLFYAILVAVGICLQGCTTSYAKDREDAKETPAGERLEISFRFQRGGIASSQYAIWIEDHLDRRRNGQVGTYLVCYVFYSKRRI